MALPNKVERIWVDLETTGLGEERDDVILEVGLILTDKYGDEIARKSSVVYSVGWRTLFRVAEPLVQDMHQNSGLLDDLSAADPMETGPTVVEKSMINFLISHGVEPKTLPMCGRTINFDRKFLMAYMPALHKMFHYRNIDVTTLDELARDLNPDIFEARPKKRDIHRAIPDLEDTVDQYSFFVENFLFVEDDIDDTDTRY